MNLLLKKKIFVILKFRTKIIYKKKKFFFFFTKIDPWGRLGYESYLKLAQNDHNEPLYKTTG